MMCRDLIIIAALALALIGWLTWQARESSPEPTRISLADVLGGSPEGFIQVTGPEPLEFPADHAAHPGHRSEWWYFTGNFETTDERRLGFQFTLFRFGIEPGPRQQSAWSADSLWMAHLALSDGATARFFQAERFARGALGLAGASQDRWWLRDWQVSATDRGWQMNAETSDFALDLTMDKDRPLVLQGDQGYSRKGPEPGNASRYYSATRLATQGRVRIDDDWHEIHGLAWLDREWGSGQLSESLQGWDWFALHLDDGQDLMIYRLRGPDGSASKYSAGVLVGVDGSAQTLTIGDFSARPQRWWRDPDGVRWPVSWHLSLVDKDLNLMVRPVFDEQVWTRSVRYWEGAVDVFDADSNKGLGRGYMELSGYADATRPTR
jgi:predicted secreted hydrolase